MSESTIWLLVADETSAQIFASSNGCSRLLRSIPNEDNVIAIGAEDAWRDRCSDFAYQLMTIMDDGAESGACEAIVMFATRTMMPALDRFMPLSVYKKLIAKIIDTPAAHTERKAGRWQPDFKSYAASPKGGPGEDLAETLMATRDKRFARVH